MKYLSWLLSRLNTTDYNKQLFTDITYVLNYNCNVREQLLAQISWRCIKGRTKRPKRQTCEMSQLPNDMINYRGRISGVGISVSNYDNNCSGLRALSLCIAVALHRPDVVRLNNLRLNNIWHWWRATVLVISLLPSSPCNTLGKHKSENFIQLLIIFLFELFELFLTTTTKRTGVWAAAPEMIFGPRLPLPSWLNLSLYSATSGAWNVKKSLRNDFVTG